MTTDGTDRARAAVQARLAELHWSRARLARESTVDPNTISDFLNGKRVPSDVTLSKLAQALELTLGTPEDSGEDDEWDDDDRGPAPRDLADVSDEQLLSELSYRMFGLRRELGRLHRQQAWRRPPGGESDDADFVEATDTTTRDDVTLAARRSPSSGKQQSLDAQEREQHSQDDGNWGPA